MKLTYEKLSDELDEFYDSFELTRPSGDTATWQEALTRLIESHGWSRAEWDAEVRRRVSEPDGWLNKLYQERM